MLSLHFIDQSYDSWITHEFYSYQTNKQKKDTDNLNII